MNKATTLCVILVKELPQIASLPVMQHGGQSNQTGSPIQLETLDYGITTDQEQNTAPRNAPVLNQYTTTDAPGVSKNLIKTLAIVIPMCLAVILAIAFTFSKKKLRERRIRKLLPQKPMEVESQDNSNHNAASAPRPSNASISTMETTVETNSNSEITNNNEAGCQEIILTVANLPSQSAPIKPSLKKNKYVQHLDPTGFRPDILLNPERRSSRQNTRPVSVELGSGVSYMRKSQNKTAARNENKRHSCAIVIESLTQSVSSSQSRLTIIENLAYEDLIPSQTALQPSDEKLKKCEDYIGIPCKAWPRSALRKQEHQYETITCSSSEKNNHFECTDKQTEANQEERMETKSDDQFVASCRSPRAVHQYEVLTMLEKDSTINLNPKEKNQTPPETSQVEIKTTNDLKVAEKQEEKQKLWPPPTLTIKRKLLSPESSEENKLKEKNQNVCEKKARENGPQSSGFSHSKISRRISNNYQRLRSKSDPYAAGKRTRRDSGTEPKLIYFPTEAFKQSEAAGSSTTGKKAKLPSKWRKVGRGKSKQTVMMRSQGGSSRVKPQPEVVKQRRRSKRKVRKTRKSRDELRQKLQLRLMGYDSGNIGVNVGTGESYKTDNNERASGFVAGPRWKLEPDRSCFYSTDTSDGDWGLSRMRRRRVYSHDEWARRWADRRTNETTLLEEIWRHLNVIAERSRLLKDSSSSRRRSQSLTSTDSSPNQRRIRHRREGETDDETLSGSSDASRDEGIQNGEPILDESTSDNGYCTYSHLPVRLRHPPTIPENSSADLPTEDNLYPSGPSDNINTILDGINTGGKVVEAQPKPVKDQNDTKTMNSIQNTKLRRSSASAESPKEEKNSSPECKDSKVVQTPDQTLKTSSIYEKLTEFCSLSSSVSSSCSSLVMPSQMSIPQVKKLPKTRSRKIPESSKNNDTSDVTDTRTKELFLEAVHDVTIDDVIKAPPNSPTLLGKKSLNMENKPKTYFNLSDVIVGLGKYSRATRKARSDSNYVVVSPSSLLRKTQKESNQQSSERSDESLTDKSHFRGNISKHFSFPTSPEEKTIGSSQGKTTELTKTDFDNVISKSDGKTGSDAGIARANDNNTEDDAPLHVFMTMTM